MSEINDGLIQYRKTNDIFSDAKEIIGCARKRAYKAADTSLVMQNWLLGRRIAEEILDGDDRARYGASVIKNLSKQLTAEFGKGFSVNNLYYCKQFFEVFPDIFHTACGELMIVKLSWSHFRTLLQVDDTDEDVARYSILKGNEQLFATKYKTYLPSQEELRREIERQKELFWLQHTEQDANPTDKEPK